MKRLILSTTMLFVFSTLSFAQKSNEIEEIANKRKLMEYELMVTPNPATGPVTIEAPKGSTCRIVSEKGTYVGTWTLEEGKLQLESMPLGNYIIHITLGDMHVQRRLLVL